MTLRVSEERAVCARPPLPACLRQAVPPPPGGRGESDATSHTGHRRGDHHDQARRRPDGRLVGGARGVAVVGAALLHDLVLLPLYATLDRTLLRGLGTRREWAGYVRVPAALSALLLLAWFPLISGSVASRYRSATGLPADVFLPRWLLITAVLFGASALLLTLRLGLRLRRAAKQRPPAVH